MTEVQFPIPSVPIIDPKTGRLTRTWRWFFHEILQRIGGLGDITGLFTSDIGVTVQADLDVLSQAEAEAGTATTERVFTAERVKQAIVALETTDLVADLSPQLGANLDVNGKTIVSVSNGDIPITPNGTGDVILDGIKYPQADGTNTQIMQTDGSGQLSFVDKPAGSGDALPIVDTTNIVKGSGDSTKQMRFEVDGITTSTTRTITMPDQDIDLTPGVTFNADMAVPSQAEAEAGTATTERAWTAERVKQAIGALPHTFRGAMVKPAADLTGVNYSGGVSVPFDAEIYDTDSIHDNSTNNTRLTVPTGVVYVKLVLNIQVSNLTDTDYINSQIRKNGNLEWDGVALGRTYANDSTNQTSISTGVVPVVATDYFEALILTESDTSINIDAGRCNFSMEIVE